MLSTMSDTLARKRLGKGLSGMLASAPAPLTVVGTAAENASPPRTPVNSPKDGVVEVPLVALEPNQHQPREEFDDAALEELASSIRQHGVIQPILVRARPGSTGYEIIAGERRWRAAKRVGLASIPVLIRDVTEQESAEWALVENLQRQDLGAMERAHAFTRLGKEFGLTHTQIAERVGMDRSSIANFVRLVELEPEIQELLRAEKLAFGHGRALLAAPSGPGRIALARDAAVGEWSVRRLERAASALGQTKRTSASASPSEVSGIKSSDAVRIDLEKRLGEYLNTRVSIRTDGRGDTGRVIIEFYNHDQFEGVLQRIGYRGA